MKTSEIVGKCKALKERQVAWVKEWVDDNRGQLKRTAKLWPELHIRAAALTYYTLVGIAPLCMLSLLLSNAVNTSVNMEPFLNFLLPEIGDSIDSVSTMVREGLMNLFDRYRVFGWIAVGIILYAVYCFLFNVQRAFNHIWQSECRPFWKSMGFSIGIVIILAAALALFTIIFNNTDSIGMRYLLSYLALTALIAAAYRTIPYDKRPGMPAVMISAAITSALLLLFCKLLPIVVNGMLEMKFEGIKLLLIVFWLFWAWIICLIGAALCRRIDKSGFYMDNDIESLAPDYRRYVTLLTVSHIFRKYDSPENNAEWLTFESIRQGMFDVEGAMANPFTKNEDASLPMPLLTIILDDLVKSGIILKKKVGRDVTYAPNKFCLDKETHLNEYTVGDILFLLDSRGKRKLDFPYWKVNQNLSDSISQLSVRMFTDDALKVRIMDIMPDTTLERADKKAALEFGDRLCENYLKARNGQSC